MVNHTNEQFAFETNMNTFKSYLVRSNILFLCSNYTLEPILSPVLDELCFFNFLFVCFNYFESYNYVAKHFHSKLFSEAFLLEQIFSIPLLSTMQQIKLFKIKLILTFPVNVQEVKY